MKGRGKRGMWKLLIPVLLFGVLYPILLVIAGVIR